MKKDIKYIIKRIIIGVSIIMILSFINKCDVHAQNTAYFIDINGTRMTSTTKKYVPANSTVTLSISADPSGNVSNTLPTFGYVALCSAFGNRQDRYISSANSSYVQNITIVNGTTGCTIPSTSDYRNTSRTTFFTFKIPTTEWDCGSGNLCTLRRTINFYWSQPLSNEFALISYGFSATSYNFSNEVDPAVYQNEQIIEQNSQQINQNNTIINQNSSIINQNSAINQSIRENNDTMNDSNVDSPYSTINDAKSKVASNSTISSLVTLPIRLYTNVLNSLNGSCATFNLGSLYGHDLTFTCINLSNVLGSTLYNIIDVILSGLLVYAISRKFIKLFNELSQLKEGDIID